MSNPTLTPDDDAIAEIVADRLVAQLENADPAVIRRVLAALRESGEEQPLATRIDAGITLTHALNLDADTDRIAARCGCSRAAIHKRHQSALRSFRATAKRTGLFDLYLRASQL